MIRLSLIALFLTLLSACSDKEEPVAVEATDQPGYALQGRVLESDLERNVLKVHHGEIPGYMPAMVMDFQVASGVARMAKKDMRIRARLIPGEDGVFWLEDVWPLNLQEEKLLKIRNRTLEKESAKIRAGTYLAEGDEMSPFALYDQNGSLFTDRRLRGKPFMMNFIFTRCPDPNMCPAATFRMAEFVDLAKSQKIEDLQFVSITLDPKHDTPGVLNDYAESFGATSENFHFLSGPEATIKQLLKNLGVTIFDDKELIVHSSSTVLVGSEGKILHVSNRKEWTIEEFVSKLK